MIEAGLGNCLCVGTHIDVNDAIHTAGRVYSDH